MKKKEIEKETVKVEDAPEKKELAVLDQEDVLTLVEANRVFRDETIRYNMLQDGIRSLAKRVQDKYKLPDLYDLEIATGKAFAKED